MSASITLNMVVDASSTISSSAYLSTSSLLVHLLSYVPTALGITTPD